MGNEKELQTESNSNKNKKIWKKVGIISLSIFLALLTMIVINL